MTPEQFKEWRKRLGFNQAEAAEALGLSRGSVLNYERGTRREDGRPVEIPLTVELACTALEMRAEKVLRAIGSLASGDGEDEDAEKEALRRALNGFVFWYERRVYDAREGRGDDSEDSELAALVKEARALID